MSKQSEAKANQRYKPYPLLTVCATCKHLTVVIVEGAGPFSTRTGKRNHLCGIGGFTVKKMGTCDLWDVKAEV